MSSSPEGKQGNSDSSESGFADVQEISLLSSIFLEAKASTLAHHLNQKEHLSRKAGADSNSSPNMLNFSGLSLSGAVPFCPSSGGASEAAATPSELASGDFSVDDEEDDSASAGMPGTKLT